MKMMPTPPPMDSGVLRMLLGRATGDSAFLERFLDDPEAAAGELYITLTPEFVDFVQSLSGELKSSILASSQQVMTAAGPQPNWSVT